MTFNNNSVVGILDRNTLRGRLYKDFLLQDGILAETYRNVDGLSQRPVHLLLHTYIDEDTLKALVLKYKSGSFLKMFIIAEDLLESPLLSFLPVVGLASKKQSNLASILAELREHITN